ncbi:MAG TPA: right-handed parallel beta-helix repeat-containing protein [Longimicrobium sp.]|nr:right-handed parallel beta-helix repeat-containing protein [Longimicrobium sp.]
MFNVKEAPYNAAGVVGGNDTDEVKAAIDAAIAAGGGEVYFPAGTYPLVDWDPIELDAPLHFRGAAPGGVTIVGPGPQGTFGLIRAPLTVEGIRFEQFGTTLDGAGSGVVAGDVVIRDCVFAASSSALSWELGGGTREEVRGLYISRCEFSGLTGGVVVGHVKADAVHFDDNRILDCKRYGLRLQAVEDPNNPLAAPGERKFVAVRNNYVRNLNGIGYAPGQDVARVVQVVAERLVVTGNDVRGVTGGGGGGNANFVYQSSLHAYVAGNYLQDVGTPGDATGGLIQEKSALAISGRYIDNVFVQTPAAAGVAPIQQPAIYIAGSGNVEIRGNDARGLHNSLVSAGFNTRNVVIAKNIVRDMRTNSAAILLYGGENVVIEGNVIDGVQSGADTTSTNYPRGIRVERYAPTAGGVFAPINVRISDNVVNAVRRTGTTTGMVEGAGIYVYMNGATLASVSIVDNTVTDCDRGFVAVAANGGSVADLEFSRNTLRGNTTAVVLSPATVTFTARHNVGYPTESSGTATVPTTPPTTAVTVPHGLARAPTVDGITVTLNGNIAPATRFWVDPVTTTTSFTVRFDVAPPAGTTFSWMAEIP